MEDNGMACVPEYRRGKVRGEYVPFAADGHPVSAVGTSSLASHQDDWPHRSTAINDQGLPIAGIMPG
jgi:hypothetical protein